MPRRQTTTTARRDGLRVRATCSRACAVRVRVSKHGGRFGMGVRILRSRRGLVTVRFSPSHRRFLARRKRVRLVLAGQATGRDTQVGPEVRRRLTLKRR